jgi:hypothetical protein
VRFRGNVYSRDVINSGKPVFEETMADARAVTVTLLHDKAHPSALYVPMGQPD